MTRKELIEKTEQLCELYKELGKEGVFGITHCLGETTIQCEDYTLAKFAGDIPTKTRERTTKEFPTETYLELDKFTAFTLNEVKQNDKG